ncbi:MAG: cobalt-precorrin 5A hydrolase [Desulfosarcina sp.]|nr:cobalt-precorrin 5A hydrolase [Desulfobacterales bacterium]
MTSLSAPIAIWALTEGGAVLGARLNQYLDKGQLYVAASVHRPAFQAESFERLRDAVVQQFERYDAHVFVMATGIVVRTLADLIRHKTVDPAVVVMDETGRHVISLLSGHLGGANALTHRIAELLGAEPVITTATDLQGLPAIDLIARERGLAIENPEAIRTISAALLRHQSIAVCDPYGCLQGALPEAMVRSIDLKAEKPAGACLDGGPTVLVHDIHVDLTPEVLILRPASLFAGIGCNRGTPGREIRELLKTVLARFGLAPESLAGIASVDLKADEVGLQAAADALNLPLAFYSRDQLANVTGIPNPSATVKKHIGISSVCEAAALLASRNGNLIVPKQTTRNVTVAIARRCFISSA